MEGNNGINKIFQGGKKLDQDLPNFEGLKIKTNLVWVRFKSAQDS